MIVWVHIKSREVGLDVEVNKGKGPKAQLRTVLEKVISLGICTNLDECHDKQV